MVSYTWVHKCMRCANAVTKNVDVPLKTLRPGARPIVVMGTFGPIDKGG